MSIRSIRSCASTRLAAATLVVAVAWTACDMPPEPVAQPPVSGPPAQASSPAPASAVETTQQEFRLSCTVWKSGFFNPFWAAQYWIGVAAFQQLVDRKVIVDKAECDQWGEDLADVPFGADPPDSLVQCMCSELRYPAAVPSNRDPVSCAGGNGCLRMLIDKVIDVNQYSTRTQIAPCNDVVGQSLYRFQRAPGDPPQFDFCVDFKN